MKTRSSSDSCVVSPRRRRRKSCLTLSPFTAADAIGVAMIAVGLYQAYPPAAWIWVGLAAIAGSFLAERSAAVEPRRRAARRAAGAPVREHRSTEHQPESFPGAD